MDTLKSVLRFFRVVDENNVLSITNIAAVLILYKVMSAPHLDLTSASMLLGALVSYQSKRFAP